LAQLQTIPVCVVLVATMISAITDIWKYKIHNLLTLPLLVAGLAYHGITGGGAGLGSSALGALCGFGVLIAFYAIGGMGAGDVKLMAAVGAWLGIPMTFYVFLAASLAAGVYSVALLVVGKGVGETWLNLQLLWLRMAAIGRHLGSVDQLEREMVRPDRRRRVIPFGAMIAVGLIAVLTLVATHVWP
jgi:prepilin peptidase CpaA